MGKRRETAQHERQARSKMTQKHLFIGSKKNEEEEEETIKDERECLAEARETTGGRAG